VEPNGTHRFATRLRDDGELHQVTIGKSTTTPWLDSLEHVQLGDQRKLRWTTSANAKAVTVLRDPRGDGRYFQKLAVKPEFDGIRWSADVDACGGCRYRLAGIDGTETITYSAAIAEGDSFNNETSVVPTTQPGTPTNLNLNPSSHRRRSLQHPSIQSPPRLRKQPLL